MLKVEISRDYVAVYLYSTFDSYAVSLVSIPDILAVSQQPLLDFDNIWLKGQKAVKRVCVGRNVS